MGPPSSTSAASRRWSRRRAPWSATRRSAGAWPRPRAAWSSAAVTPTATACGACSAWTRRGREAREARMRLKIALVVHGRFHAFDLARELLRRGHEVTVFTNSPRWAVKRFGVPAERVRGFWQHGVLSRATWQLAQHGARGYSEAWLHTMFGRWASAQVA